MNERNQGPEPVRQEDKPTILVGMDAHTRKLALCVAEWRHGSDPHVVRKFPYVSISEMEAVYSRHIPKDSLTLIEASGNSRSIKERLGRIGFTAKVLRSDVLKSIQKRDKVCDSTDAEKLTFAYARGNARDEVWTASDKFRDWRDLLSAHKRCVCDASRHSNRIWGFCESHNLGLPARRHAKKIAEIEGKLGNPDLSALERDILKGMADDYRYALKRREAVERQILGIVVRDKTMLRLMQLPGVGPITAFAIVAFVEDIGRFESPKKLVAYFGVNPAVNSSGEQEERNRRKGREHGHLSDFGRSDLKAYCSEIGQSVLRREDFELAKWGRRLLAKGKLYNKVVMAVARKIVTYAWHVLHGDPTPNREAEPLYRRKLCKLYHDYGRDSMRDLGYARNAIFAETVAGPLYAHLPDGTDGLQTAVAPASV